MRPNTSQRDVGRFRHSPRRRQVVAIRATFLRIPVRVPLVGCHGRETLDPSRRRGRRGNIATSPDAHALQFGDAPSFEGGSGASQTFAFLDDVCVVCLPERVQTVVSILASELWNHAHIQVHDGKTQVWNRASHELTARARIQDPNAVVWSGDAGLDPSQRGLKVLGAPIGCDEFVRTQLHATATKQASLLQKISAVRDLQSAWLLLL